MTNGKSLMLLTNWLNEDKGEIGRKGRRANLADALGISRQALYNWKSIPAEHVLKIEEITGISRHDLAPNIYPNEANR